MKQKETHTHLSESGVPADAVPEVRHHGVPGGRTRWTLKLSLAVLSILPVILVFTSLYLGEARGPDWLGNNLDPEYVYLLNGSNLAHMKGVGHIDHPGTPVQVLTAVTMRITHALRFSVADNLKTDVLKHPEYYINVVHWVMTLLNALVLLFTGWVALRMTGNIWLGVFLQSAPFLSVTLLVFGLTRMTPEPLLLAVSSLMIPLVLWISPPDHHCTFKTVLAAGLITGFGIAVKITFIPMMAVPFIGLPGLKKKAAYVGVTVGGFVLFTLPIIRMYPRFFDWIFNLLSHSGQYGGGASKVVAVDTYLQNIKTLLTANSFFSLSLCAVFAVLAVGLLHPGLRGLSLRNRYYKYLAAVAIAQAGGVLMVSKHSANHYLLPVLNLSALGIVLLFLYLKSMDKGNRNRNYRAVAFMVFWITMLIYINPLHQITDTASRLDSEKTKCMELYRFGKNYYKDGARIYYYRSSAPEYALKFGDDISRSYHSQLLDQLYPNVYFYDIWTHRFSRYDINRPIPFSAIRKAHGDRIVFQGTRGVAVDGITLKEIQKAGRHEAVFVPIFLEDQTQHPEAGDSKGETTQDNNQQDIYQQDISQQDISQQDVKQDEMKD